VDALTITLLAYVCVALPFGWLVAQVIDRRGAKRGTRYWLFVVCMAAGWLPIVLVMMGQSVYGWLKWFRK
jgi:hypothetical protein